MKLNKSNKYTGQRVISALLVIPTVFTIGLCGCKEGYTTTSETGIEETTRIVKIDELDNVGYIIVENNDQKNIYLIKKVLYQNLNSYGTYLKEFETDTLIVGTATDENITLSDINDKNTLNSLRNWFGEYSLGEDSIKKYVIEKYGRKSFYPIEEITSIKEEIFTKKTGEQLPKQKVKIPEEG